MKSILNYSEHHFDRNIERKKTLRKVTTGIVGGASFSVLPEIGPLHCIILMMVSILPMLWKVWESPKNNEIIGYVICALASFIFGYHVHEKAILLAIVPFIALG